MHTSTLLEGTFLAIVLFDIRSAFPSVSWEWIWRVLRRSSAPDWVITALKLLYNGSFSEVAFAGEASAHGFPVRRGILQGCPASGSLWAILFDPIVRALIDAHLEPRGSLTAFADDLAAAFLNACAWSGTRRAWASGARPSCARTRRRPTGTGEARRRGKLSTEPRSFRLFV